MKMSIVTITSDNFEQEVIHSDQPVLLDFWASWCMPCRMFSPTFAEAAEEVSAVKFGKINVEEQPELARKFRVMSIPTLILVKDGVPVQTSVGMKNKDGIMEMLGK
jgi:thioredoxin 1